MVSFPRGCPPAPLAPDDRSLGDDGQGGQMASRSMLLKFSCRNARNCEPREKGVSSGVVDIKMNFPVAKLAEHCFSRILGC